MKPKIKPIRDLWFRFIYGSKYVGRIDAQRAALILSRRGLIELIPHHSEPLISHYRDVDLDLTDKKVWAVFSESVV